MKIISQKELGHMPNGTVFSRITDPLFYKGTNGDMEINGLNIICGHDEDDIYSSSESGHFHACVHMLEFVTHHNKVCDNEDYDEDYWFTTIDTCEYDYEKDEYFVIYSQDEVKAIIRNLEWALNGCEGEQIERTYN